jgi:hypothetical protein
MTNRRDEGIGPLVTAMISYRTSTCSTFWFFSVSRCLSYVGPRSTWRAADLSTLPLSDLTRDTLAQAGYLIPKAAGRLPFVAADLARVRPLNS